MRKIHAMNRPLHTTREVAMSYFNCEGRTVYVTDTEVGFPDGCLITSRCDLNGVITHANDAFVQLSGWERDELIGQTHEILRHPDMPKAAFANLWATVSRGEKWHGYVKNLRKDGAFYWVYATVIPNIRCGKIIGYTSVRRKPARDKVVEIEQVYAKMLAVESLIRKETTYA